jgi:hypothetical protein
MRTRARWQEERPNNSLCVDGLPRDPRSSNMSFECRLRASPITACRFQINGKGLHD